MRKTTRNPHQHSKNKPSQRRATGPEKVILLNKPFQVLSQFTTDGDKRTLAEFITATDCYPAGRLDYDSEGLLLLTNNGKLQQQISDPRFKLPKTYWAQVEGIPDEEALEKLRSGIMLKDGLTLPAEAKLIEEPLLWSRVPPIRERQSIPTAWIELVIREGKNRQVRRMTAAAGFPTLRLIRYAVGPITIADIANGDSREASEKERQLLRQR